MAASSDDKYLFTSDTVNNCIKQFSIIDGKMIKDYNIGPSRHGIHSMVITFDSKYVFVGTTEGRITQICIKTTKITKKYPKVHSW